MKGHLVVISTIRITNSKKCVLQNERTHRYN